MHGGKDELNVFNTVVAWVVKHDPNSKEDNLWDFLVFICLFEDKQMK